MARPEAEEVVRRLEAAQRKVIEEAVKSGKPGEFWVPGGGYPTIDMGNLGRRAAATERIEEDAVSTMERIARIEALRQKQEGRGGAGKGGGGGGGGFFGGGSSGRAPSGGGGSGGKSLKDYLLGSGGGVNVNLWLFFSIVLFVLDTGLIVGIVPWLKFNGHDFIFIVQNFGIDELIKITFNVAAILLFYLIAKGGRLSGRELWAKFWLLLLAMFIITTTSFTVGSMIHILFALFFYFMVLRTVYSDPADADLTMVVLLFVDFFGFSLLAKFGGLTSYGNAFLLIKRFFVFPIYFFYLVFSSRTEKNGKLAFLGIIILFVIVISSLDLTYQAYEQSFDVEKTEELKTMWDRTVEFFTGIPKQAKIGYERQMEYATGGYYKGQVEEAEKEPIGVYLENIKASDKKFFQDEKVAVWATLKAKTLDENQKIDINLRCYSDYDTKETVSGVMYPQDILSIYRNHEEDVDCRFEEGELPKGNRKISIFAAFNFETIAYLKTYFMDINTMRAMERDNVDILGHYGITDKNPVAKFSNGPVRIGMEVIKTQPIGIGKDYDATPVLGITLENQWEGKIKRINEIVIYIPEDIELDETSCNVGFEEFENPDYSQEGYRSYKLADDVKDSDPMKEITEFKSFRCRLKAPKDKAEIIMGGVPFATIYFRARADYIYELKAETSAEVTKPEGLSVDIKSDTKKPTAASKLECEATHSKDIIEKIDYYIYKNKELIKEEKDAACNSKSCKVPISLADIGGLKGKDEIKCVVTAKIGDKKETDSDMITIGNTLPKISVKITKDDAGFVCTGAVSDEDDDEAEVVYSFGDGVKKEGRCGRSKERICRTEAIPSSELQVGETIRCKMTPKDTENGEAATDYLTVRAEG